MHIPDAVRVRGPLQGAQGAAWLAGLQDQAAALAAPP
jgi:hypothetical protein